MALVLRVMDGIAKEKLSTNLIQQTAGLCVGQTLHPTPYSEQPRVDAAGLIRVPTSCTTQSDKSDICNNSGEHDGASLAGYVVKSKYRVLTLRGFHQGKRLLDDRVDTRLQV